MSSKTATAAPLPSGGGSYVAKGKTLKRIEGTDPAPLRGGINPAPVKKPEAEGGDA